MLGRNEDDVVGAPTRNEQTGNVERLRIDMAVHIVSEEFAESAAVDVGGRQDRFVEILSGPAIIVMVSEDIDLRYGGKES